MFNEEPVEAKVGRKLAGSEVDNETELVVNKHFRLEFLMQKVPEQEKLK